MVGVDDMDMASCTSAVRVPIALALLSHSETQRSSRAYAVSRSVSRFQPAHVRSLRHRLHSIASIRHAPAHLKQPHHRQEQQAVVHESTRPR